MRIETHPILPDLPERNSLSIYVDGKKITAYENDTIAAAMFAAGIKVNRTTSVYHEPRGVFCNKGRCTDCIMKVNGLPNIRTCITKVSEGMAIETIEGLGSWGGK